MKLVNEIYTIRPLFERPGLDTFVLEIGGRTHIGTRKYVEYRLKKYKEQAQSLIYSPIGSDEQFKIRYVAG